MILYVAGQSLNQAQGNFLQALFFLYHWLTCFLSVYDTTPTTAVQQVAQILVIDQNDVLSIAADMAIAAAIAAAAAEDKTASSIGPLGTPEAQQDSYTDGPVTSDVFAGRDVADGIGAGEIIGESVSAASSAAKKEASDTMLQQEAAAASITTSDAKSAVTESEFAFSPITLAPESSRSSAHHSAKATSKPSAHVSSPAAAVIQQQVKSASSSSTLSMCSMVSFTLSLGLMGYFL